MHRTRKSRVTGCIYLGERESHEPASCGGIFGMGRALSGGLLDLMEIRQKMLLQFDQHSSHLPVIADKANQCKCHYRDFVMPGFLFLTGSI